MNWPGYLSVAETAPALLLENEKPILFDEWQDALKIWGAIGIKVIPVGCLKDC